MYVRMYVHTCRCVVYVCVSRNGECVCTMWSMGVYMCVGKSAHMLGGNVSGAASLLVSIL